ncbi:MAG: FCD domain-containing protein [Brooklawnia sp.]|uniref:FadR/GntR family transcriptional regulator n=1 Tax=Brooklawnia sp. TaxID=2699740 RepID=UPI003C73B574
MLLGEPETRDLIEMRSVLEIDSARFAATRASEDARAELAQNFADMERAMPELSEVVKHDFRFHVILAENCGNQLIADALRVCRTLLRIWMDRALRDVSEAEDAIREHKEILHAIQARDGDAAAAAMTVHMQTATRRLIKLA